jgi:hypothetical protein
VCIVYATVSIAGLVLISSAGVLHAAPRAGPKLVDVSSMHIARCKSTMCILLSTVMALWLSNAAD